jgi:hypothetical protein
LIEDISDLLLVANEEAGIKNIAVQILMSLIGIDSQLVDVSLSKLDPAKRAPLRKVMIEIDNMNSNGKGVVIN